jgi:hypothetical protein
MSTEHNETQESGTGELHNDLNIIESYQEEVPENQLVKISRKPKKYELYEAYNDVKIARKVLDEEFLGFKWHLKKTTSTAKGITHWYHCSEGLRSKKQDCPKVIQLAINASTETCIILQSLDEHVHNPLPEGKIKHGIEPEVKIKIKEFEALGLKPSHMLIQLRKYTTKIPTQLQLSNYLKEVRKNLEGDLGVKICLQDFENFYAAHKPIPEDDDQMFVADCKTEVFIEKGEMVRIFRIFLTTKRLISFTKHVSLLF